jgi:hypothetical protein
MVAPHVPCRREHVTQKRIEGPRELIADDPLLLNGSPWPGNIALARAIATATKLDLATALDGRFIVTDKGIKAIGGARRNTSSTMPAIASCRRRRKRPASVVRRSLHAFANEATFPQETFAVQLSRQDAQVRPPH